VFKFFRVISFKKILLICLIFILIVIIATISCNTNIINRLTKTNSVNSIINSNIVGAEYLNQMSNISTEELVEDLEKDHEYELANLNSWESQLELDKNNYETRLNEITSFESTWTKLLQNNVKSDFTYGGAQQ